MNARLQAPLLSTVPVLVPLTAEARASVPRGACVRMTVTPFRFGRESRLGREPDRRHAERRADGGAPNNEVYLLDGGRQMQISREHFEIDLDADGRWLVRDRGSACGTWAGGTPLGLNAHTLAAPIAEGDMVVVGTAESPYRFRFELDAGDVTPGSG